MSIRTIALLTALAFSPGIVHAATPAQKCSSGKRKAAAKMASDQLGCYAKAAAAGAPVVPSCLQKAEDKLLAAYNKLDLKGGCLTTADGVTLAAQIGYFTGLIASELPSLEEICDNGVDDDGDGQTDCMDSSCVANPLCAENCTNGVDDNGNGLIDCFDLTCFADPACQENCTNGIDDNGDTLVDCADYQCFGNPACNTCGNNVIEGLEVCDGTDLGAQTCNSVTGGFLPNGTLACESDCFAYNVSACTQ